MFVIIGLIIVIGSVLGGFSMAGGKIGALIHPSEFVTIGGAAIGAMVIMSPLKVLIGVIKGVIQTLKGAPYTRNSYEELLKVLYELFMIARRNGMIALEEHVTNPDGSNIFKKYQLFNKNHHGVEFLAGALRPVVDGRVKPEQLKVLLDAELKATEEEHHAPLSVVVRVADALPGFGIVAAVLGIVVTMGAINGPVEEIGHKVGAALVGTFLGILLSYGFLGPVSVNMEFNGHAEMAYLHCIATAVNSFANGMAPIMAVEVARRGLNSEVRPTEAELETMLKGLGTQG